MPQDTVLTHDAAVSAFDGAGGVVDSDGDGVEFSFDEQHVVTVDAPADFAEAFDTDQFYKIEGATVARPIRQPYLMGDSVEWYQKPADELRRAAWTFDNTPFTLGHPDTGMVKSVDDIHGFWRNPRYDDTQDRLKEDLYIPTNDDDAIEFIREHQDVSPGFYNRYRDDFDGDTGGLVDNHESLDGYQVDMYGNHIAGVEEGRCSGEDGCGLDSRDFDGHGTVVNVDAPTVQRDHDRDYAIVPPTTDYSEDGTYYAIAPDETGGDSPKYPINSCSDVQDAWHLRGHGDYQVDQSTLEDRIRSRARELNCRVPDSDTYNTDCKCGGTDNNDEDTDMTDDNNDYDIPELSIDALASKNDAVESVVDERDELTEQVNELEDTIDEMESEITAAFDDADAFSVELDEDECPCEAVDDLVTELDEKADAVEDLREELDEYREQDIEERLDTLEDLGADRDEWRETADEADSPLDALDEEIERREEVLDAADDDTSVKDIDSNTDEADETTDSDTTIEGTRTFERGFGT